MFIQRQTYLDKLIHSMGNGYIKIITGLRRCGKSFLLNTLFYNYLKENVTDEAHIIRFAFDSAADLQLIGENPVSLQWKKSKADPFKFMDYIKKQIKPGEKYYLLLDEIQELGAFESVLNSYLRDPNIDTFVTGSNAKFLSKDLITEFAGRSDRIHVFPFSFGEFMTAYTGDKYQGLRDYMLYGGMPTVVLESDPIKKKSILQNLFEEVYVRDIVRRNRIKNESDLDDILNVLASAIGSLSNAEKIQKTLKSAKRSDIKTSTVSKYIRALEDSFLIRSARRFDIKGKRFIGSPQKFYFTDPGLRNARLNFRQFEETHLLENVIYNELLYRGYAVDVGVVEISEKNKNGTSIRKKLEIDFVCNLGEKRIYIQSALSMPDAEKREVEIRPFAKVKDSFRKVIITKDLTPAFYDDHGILTMNIFDFLQGPALT